MTLYHGEEVPSIRHRPVLTTLAAGTFTYRNNTGKRLWIQKFALSPSGTVSVYVQVNGRYWSALQQGTPTGITDDNPVALSLVDRFDFAAMNENEEMALESNSTITVQIASGAGSVQIAFILAQGEES